MIFQNFEKNPQEKDCCQWHFYILRYYTMSHFATHRHMSCVDLAPKGSGGKKIALTQEEEGQRVKREEHL